MKVRQNVVEMGGRERYLHLLVGHGRGRMGYECLGEQPFLGSLGHFFEEL